VDATLDDADRNNDGDGDGTGDACTDDDAVDDNNGSIPRRMVDRRTSGDGNGVNESLPAIPSIIGPTVVNNMHNDSMSTAEGGLRAFNK
jgi:hypothetical protein